MPRNLNSPLSAAIDNFGRSHEYVLKPLTMRCYMGSLRRFNLFVGQKATMAALDTDNVDAYIASIADHRYMARTDCSVLKVFSRWCAKSGYAPEDMLRSVTAPKVPKWRPKPLERDFAERVIELAAEHPTLGVRDKAIIMLSLNTGARPNEIRQLRYQDVDLTSRIVHIREETSKTSAGERRIPISPQTANAVREYVERERPEKPGPLFLNAHGDAFTYYGFLAIHHRLRDALKAEGIPGYQAYRLRHSGITNMVKAGITTLRVQRLAGHKSPITTQNYVGDMDDAELQGLPDAFTNAYGRVV